ncbi:hypothetical protein R3P38DRAFT_2865732 [Favolaschia claudopus]|uniref:Secreted protein n=1 Tax=Favolaschia claudopus TaxID=2862362 RepID=A0AAW0DIE1_9AGAR
MGRLPLLLCTVIAMVHCRSDDLHCHRPELLLFRQHMELVPGILAAPPSPTSSPLPFAETGSCSFSSQLWCGSEGWYSGCCSPRPWSHNRDCRGR